MSGRWPWLAVAMLGAYHGIDPSMGWLFAVALGLQEKRRSRVLSALIPIAAGHLLSIGIIVALIGSLQLVTATEFFRPAGAAALVLFGLFRLFRPRAHPRWVAMRVNDLELALWSFLMASAHGAGLMLFPVLMTLMPSGEMPAMHHRMMPPLATTFSRGLMVTIVHTTAMLVVMGAVAIVVYDRIGLAILRSAWINLDLLWAGALIVAGVLSFFL